ncbi:unnamed protein product [Lasius platythorax]|uniref:Uncharacterized protein n=1 Tax=Lasius platythorax TaxID=488582 RepID=A0AAV2P883_9HYME
MMYLNRNQFIHIAVYKNKPCKFVSSIVGASARKNKRHLPIAVLDKTEVDKDFENNAGESQEAKLFAVISVKHFGHCTLLREMHTGTRRDEV